MDALVDRILAARRKRFIGSAPIFRVHEPVSEKSLKDVERKIGCALPESLRMFLLAGGYGDINDEFSLRKEWFNLIEQGELAGHVIFAQDDLGNFYTFSPSNGCIHFICRSKPEYGFMATGFEAFLHEYERHRFQLEAWTNGLHVAPYEWGV